MANSVDQGQTAPIYGSSLFWVHAVWFYTQFVSNVGQLFAADDFSKRHFQMDFFFLALQGLIHVSFSHGCPLHFRRGKSLEQYSSTSPWTNIFPLSWANTRWTSTAFGQRRKVLLICIIRPSTHLFPTFLPLLPSGTYRGVVRGFIMLKPAKKH